MKNLTIFTLHKNWNFHKIASSKGTLFELGVLYRLKEVVNLSLYLTYSSLICNRDPPHDSRVHYIHYNSGGN